MADRRPADSDAVLRMRDRLVHRGPDDAGLWVDGEVALAHRRLSILDLSPAGRQPMANEDGSVMLVFNGEIYNFQALTEELRGRGHTFHSETDSEVILHLYEEMGEECVHRLRGMFAFAIFDARTRTIFGARDRSGIKPFYYRQGRGGFAFASEVKGLLDAPGMVRRMDPLGLADILFCGRPLANRTLLDEVRSLPPGHRFVADGQTVRIDEYWRMSFDYRHDRPYSRVVDDVAGLLEESVALHCLSDAPLGAHLSGGLDSSTVATLAAGRRPAPLDTFCIRFDAGASFDETPFAEIAAGHSGADLHVATPDPAALGRLFATLIWHLDQPVSGEPGFTYGAAARLAADQVKVSLTGHGGDELFAGYPAQFATAFGTTSAFSGPATNSYGSVRSPWSRVLRAVRSGGLFRHRLGRRAADRRMAECTEEEQLWIQLHCGPVPLRNDLLHPDLRTALGDYCPIASYLKEFREAGTDEILDRCLHHDLRTYLPQLLHKEDRMSMAVSLESRVPLLDHELIEYMATVPPAQKVPEGEPKGLLRAAARRWLPPEVVDRRDKSPFPIPVSEWMDRGLGDSMRRMLTEERSLDRGVFDPAAMRDPRIHQGKLLQMASMESWCRSFLDRDEPPILPPSEEWWKAPVVRKTAEVGVTG